ncbi:MAG: uL15 family ribosomal protein, partial [Bacilli bacterium]
RLPKRGFNHYGRVEFSVVNVCDLNKFEDGTVVNPALLVKEGLIPSNYAKVKVLGNGELTKKLTVTANQFSKSAEEAIKAVGGTTEVI